MKVIWRFRGVLSQPIPISAPAPAILLGSFPPPPLPQGQAHSVEHDIVDLPALVESHLP
jgi:hypothetical protein